MPFRPAPGHIGEDRQNGNLKIVIPKNLRIMPEKQPAKEENERSDADRA